MLEKTSLCSDVKAQFLHSHMNDVIFLFLYLHANILITFKHIVEHIGTLRDQIQTNIKLMTLTNQEVKPINAHMSHVEPI